MKPTSISPRARARSVRAAERDRHAARLSKSYGLAGLRLGSRWPSRLIARVLKVKDSYNCDALSLAGATAALRGSGLP